MFPPNDKEPIDQSSPPPFSPALPPTIPQTSPLPYKETPIILTFAPPSPPQGTFSRLPLNAPSVSPPRNNCRICPANCCASCVLKDGYCVGNREVRGKLVWESGSRASMLIVRQFWFWLDVVVIVVVKRGSWERGGMDSGGGR